MQDLKKSLHEHEKKILLALEEKKEMTEEELAEETSLPNASVSHASLWLYSKDLVEIKESKTIHLELNKEGKNYLEEELPERKALKEVKNGLEVKELEERLGKKKAKIAITWLMKKNLARIEAGHIELTEDGEEALYGKTKEEKALEYLKKPMKEEEVPDDILETLRERGKIIKETEETKRTVQLTEEGKKVLKDGIELEKKTNVLTHHMLKSNEWKEKEFRQYDIQAPVEDRKFGKKHFVSQAMDYVRKIWIELGFKEMNGPLINSSFWNFDALFVPQDHPARELQDTFYIEPEQADLPEQELVKRVKEAHEEGVAGSKGWQYDWSEEEARKRVLRTHATVLSAKTISKLTEDDLPSKYFSVGRCFRNESLDWSHLFEFNQVEGIVVDPDVNFKHLLGYLKQFFGKLGFEKARFRPAYFPYTEPSLEIEVMHPEKKSWIELGGAGILRPEVVEPLLGKEVPVLAWGMGYDRLIMDYYNIQDIRKLYSNDLKTLKEMKNWMRY